MGSYISSLFDTLSVLSGRKDVREYSPLDLDTFLHSRTGILMLGLDAAGTSTHSNPLHALRSAGLGKTTM